MSRLSLIPFLERWREKAIILYRKALKRVFSVVILLFALIFALAFTVVGYNLTRTESRESNATNSQFSTLIKVSFYDANLDFNGSIRVKANSSINIAQLKDDLDLNATVLYLADGTTSDYINNASYQVKRSVNFYATPSVQEIKTEVELDAIRADATTLAGKYILLNDIELTSVTLGNDGEEGWNPIGDGVNQFKGIFNGNGYAVRNLWINRSIYYVGLLGYIDNAKIKNLGVEIDNSKGGVKGDDYVGGIAGEVSSNSLITNSYSMGNISGYYRVGGIAGSVGDSSITNSYSTGDVSGIGDYVGGIAGYVDKNSSITNSYSTGNVSGNDCVSGIAGDVSGSSITNSYSTGNVSGTGYFVGAIAGDVSGSSITNSYSTGNVSGDKSVGGIAGSVDKNSSITNSYSTGNVSGNDSVGGIAGYVFDHSSITNSYSTGNVSGTYEVGGIAGSVGDSSITNSYSTGDVSGTYEVGGIAGWARNSTIKNNATINQEVNGSSNVNRAVGVIGGSTVENNFTLDSMTTSGGGAFSNASAPAYHGTSKSIAALKSSSTYSEGLGWKFGNDDDNPWKIDASKNDGYPYLYWQK